MRILISVVKVSLKIMIKNESKRQIRSLRKTFSNYISLVMFAYKTATWCDNWNFWHSLTSTMSSKEVVYSKVNKFAADAQVAKSNLWEIYSNLSDKQKILQVVLLKYYTTIFTLSKSIKSLLSYTMLWQAGLCLVDALKISFFPFSICPPSTKSNQRDNNKRDRNRSTILESDFSRWEKARLLL